MKTKRILLASIATLLTAAAARAVDYNFGSVTENFTLTATDQARALPGGTASGVTFNDNAFGGVYDRGAERDATYMHFNLSSLAGGTINGTVSLNLTIDAQFGGAINSGVVGSATNAWSYPGTTGGITTISGADPSGSYTTGQTATAVIDNTTFQGFATNLGTFNGLAITAGAGSTAHFSGPATLTGNATTGMVTVAGGTDWSAAVWNGGTSTLSISGANDVSGGAVTVRAGATLAVTGSATLGGGTFSGTFANAGALSFGSSANQTLSGAISGSGSFTQAGSGTTTLNNQNNTYSGGTTVNAGVLAATRGSLGTGAVVINNGGTLNVADQWVFSGVNDHGVIYSNPVSLTVNAGGALQLDNTQGFANGINHLFLNGGSVTGGPNNSRGDLYLYKGNEQITAGGATTSTIASVIGVTDNNNTITVDTGSTLSITGLVKDSNWTGSPVTGGFIKAGAGTLALSGANTYTGATTVNGGTLQVSGQSYFNVGRATTIASGAVFELNNSNNTFTTLMPTSTVTGAGTFRLSGNSTIEQAQNGVSGNRLIFAMDAGGLIDLQGTSRLTNGGWQEVNWTNNMASMNIASGATLDVWDGQDVIIDALTGSGTVDKIHGGNSPSLLKLGVAGGSGIFSGTIQNTAAQVALTKGGAGTQTLSCTNTYTGATTVNAGTLLVSGSISGSNVTVDGATAVLGGSGGTITGSVSLQNGGTLAPGASAGDLTVNGAVSFASGTTLALEIVSAGSFDQLTIGAAGSLSSNAGTLTLALGYAPTPFVDSFMVVENTSAGATAEFANLADGASIFATFNAVSYEFLADYQGGTGNDLVLLAVPEPNVAITLLGGLGMLLGLRRRRA